MRVAGVDVGRVRDSSTVVVLGDDGIIQGAHRLRLGETWRSNVSTIVHLVRGCALVAVDATGVGGPVVEALEVHQVRVLPFTLTSARKPVLLLDLAQALPRLRMDPDAPGADELRRFTAKTMRRGYACPVRPVEVR